MSRARSPPASVSSLRLEGAVAQVFSLANEARHEEYLRPNVCRCLRAPADDPRIGAATAAAARARSADSAELQAGHGGTPEETRGQRLADDPPHLQRVGLQPARSDHAGQRQPAAAGVVLLDRPGQRPRGAADRQQRRDVRRHARQPGDRHRGEDRHGSLALQEGAGGGRHRAPPDQPRRRALRRQGLFRRGRRGARGHRCQDRQRSVGHQGRGEQERLLHDAMRRSSPTAR